MKTAQEKAIELYNLFQVYYWSDDDGYLPDDKETKKLAINCVNEIIQVEQAVKMEFWKEVKKQIQLL
jgi:hypothetical protein